MLIEAQEGRSHFEESTKRVKCEVRSSPDRSETYLLYMGLIGLLLAWCAVLVAIGV